MARNSSFGTATFSAPKVSKFPLNNIVRMTNGFGKLMPVQWYETFPSSIHACRMSYFMRMDALARPIMDGLDVTFDAHFVPWRLCGFDSMKFFNLSKVNEGKTLPVMPMVYSNTVLCLMYTYHALNGYFHRATSDDDASYTLYNYRIAPTPLLDTLWARLGYPVDVQGYNSYLSDPNSWFKSNRFLPTTSGVLYSSDALSSSESVVVSGSVSLVDFDYNLLFSGAIGANNDKAYTSGNTILGIGSIFSNPTAPSYNNVWSYSSFTGTGAYSGSVSTFLPSFLLWCANQAVVTSVNITNPFSLAYTFSTLVETLGFENPSLSSEYTSLNWLADNGDEFAKRLGYASYDNLVQVYKDFVFCVANNARYLSGTTLNFGQKVNILPFLAYHRMYLDKYINTNVIDPDNYYSAYIGAWWQFFNNSYENSAITSSVSSYLNSLRNAVFSGEGTGNLLNSFAYVHLVATYDQATRPSYENYPLWFDFLSIPNREFAPDAFTTATLGAQQGSAVLIPSGGTATMTDLRDASALQKFRERLNYAGRRFYDVVKAVFGVAPKDLRNQYTEPLGRWTDIPQISDVLQTSATTSDSAQGNQAGVGVGSGKSGNFFKYTASEHGIIFIVQSIMPRMSYPNPVDKFLFKGESPLDYLTPQFAEIGDDAIMCNEIDASASSTTVFGYNRRYYEYMYKADVARGEFLTTKKDWVLTRDFTNYTPTLNRDFLEPTFDDNFGRVFAFDSDGATPFNCICVFNTELIAPLPRDIKYHL